MSDERIGVGIIGCGDIAGSYAADLKRYPELDFVGAADIVPERAEAYAKEHEIAAFKSVESLLADPRVKLVINLTTLQAHTDVITQCLQAGKHTFSEKPLAMTTADAMGLVALAEEKNLRLGCAPSTFLGEAQQTVLKLLRQGKLGTPRVAYADINHGRIETWHPAPASFYAAGPVFDIGAYVLVLLTTAFGPARRVSACGKVLLADRKDLNGNVISVKMPDFVVANVTLADGVLLRMTTNFYVDGLKKQSGIEIHGDEGSVYVDTAYMFNSNVSFATFEKKYEQIPCVSEPFDGVEWGRGVRDMATAIREGTPHRATGKQEAHIVEVMCAIHESVATETPVEITSDFDRPAPMDWAV